MIPVLFSSDSTNFTSHGIGDLLESMRCETVVNAEGEYELELEYPAGGKYINQLVINNIIRAKANNHEDEQLFRIYNIEKNISNLVTVHAQHISYDLACVPVKAYTASTCSAAVSGLKTNAVISSDVSNYTFYTNVTGPAQNTEGKFKIEEPIPLRSALLDGDDSIKGTFGGDLVFDNYNISLLKVGGAERGITIEYGIDMMDMALEETISEMITGVYPYWHGREDGADEDTIVYGSVQYVSGSFERQRITSLNVAQYFPNNKSAPSVSEINAKAREWMAAEDLGEPEFNLTLSYAELGKDIRLHDALTVRFTKIGIDVKAKVVSYRYDTLKERCIEVEVGNVKPSILFDLEDASRLKRGLMPPERIANKSISGGKIANNAVCDWHLKDGAVVTAKIDEGAVTEEKIGEWAVTEGKIADLTISSAKIQNGAVGNQQLGEASVTHDKIGQGEIYTANLGDASVSSIKIKDGEVITAKIADDAITAQKVSDLAITTAKIGNSAITSAKIKNGEVVEGKIGNQAVSFDKVKDANIDQLKLNDFSVTSTKIADNEWAYNYATKQWEKRSPAVGTYALQNSAVVSAKIGNYQVADIKLVQKTQDAIATVWELQDLVASNIDTQGLTISGYHLGFLSSGGNRYVIAI